MPHCPGSNDACADSQQAPNRTTTSSASTGTTYRSLKHDQVPIQIRNVYTALGRVSRVTGLDSVLPDAANGNKLIPDVYCPQDAEVIDVSITFPCAQAYVQEAATTDGSAAQKRETGKTKKYKTVATTAGLKFAPAVFETYGRAGQMFRTWFADKVSEAEDQLPANWDTNWSARTFSAHFQQRLSVALQRGNAQVIRHRSRRDHFRAPLI